MPSAVLVDGGFFLRRYRSIYGDKTPSDVATGMHKMCQRHLTEKSSRDGVKPPRRRLFRIFYYDCPPLMKKAHNPITGKSVDFSKTPTALWRLAFFDGMKKMRKVALRLGDLNEKGGYWTVNRRRMDELLKQKVSIGDLTEDDVTYNVNQKGVDMRIGLDIASMCYKKFVDQIILISGDSDFVPAAKLARREGVDFILDPMWADIRSDLFEHIDGLRSVLPRPQQKQSSSQNQLPDSVSESARGTLGDNDFGAGIE